MVDHSVMRRNIDEAIEAYKLAYLSAKFKKEKAFNTGWDLPYELLGYIVIKVRR